MNSNEELIKDIKAFFNLEQQFKPLEKAKLIKNKEGNFTDEFKELDSKIYAASVDFKAKYGEEKLVQLKMYKSLESKLHHVLKLTKK